LAFVKLIFEEATLYTVGSHYCFAMYYDQCHGRNDSS